MTRQIRYKEPSQSLERIAAPSEVHTNRASVGMDQFVGEYYYLAIDKLIPYKNQSRTVFDEKELNQMSETIRVHGIRQPLSVIASDSYTGKYEVVSGERRLRAAKIVGLDKVPCIILSKDAQKDEIALVENIQRADLHTIEFARGVQKLVEDYGWGGQTEIERRLGIQQSRISEAMKILTLPKEIQDLCIEKNYTGRDKLLSLLKLKTDDEMKKRILGSVKEKTSFSVFRVICEDNMLSIQKNGIKKLPHELRESLKITLSEILSEL